MGKVTFFKLQVDKVISSQTTDGNVLSTHSTQKNPIF